MNLNAMTLADLDRMAAQIDTLSRAVREIEASPLNQDPVMICMAPGQPVTIITGLIMPDLAGPRVELIDDDDDFAELPGGSPAPEHWAGSGACSGVENAESPADVAPRSGADAGEGPAVAKTADAVPGEGQADPPGTADVSSSDQPAAEPGAMNSDKLGMDWARTEEVLLVAGVVRRVRAGMSKTKAMAEMAAELGRTEAATAFRMNKKLADEYRSALAEAAAELAAPAPDADGQAPGSAVPLTSPPAEPQGDRGPINLPDAPAPLTAIAGLSAREREIAAEVARVPPRKGFDPETDLDIVEGFSLGTTPDVLAADLGMDSKAVRDRFKDLTACIRDGKGNMDFADQGRLLAVLRQIVRAARDRAA